MKMISTGYTLAEFGEGEYQKRTINLPDRVAVVGRSTESDVTIVDPSISKKHAILRPIDERLSIQDLGSTNGTFVNGKQVVDGFVVDGDLLQFANVLFRVGIELSSEPDCATIQEGILPWAETLLQFDKLLSDRSVTPHFQPIVQMNSGKVIAYEILARSPLSGLTNPAEMFGAAERLGQQAALSEMMRDEGLRHASNTGIQSTGLYLNTHPKEIVNDRFIQSLFELRSRYPDLEIMIEIHESAVTNPQQINDLRKTLNQLEMGLSYDDFGAGQGRLLELAESPPDVLKFDMSLIRDIDSASESRKELVTSLVKVARDVGATPLAEGVETAPEHETCIKIGFELGQGYYYGSPKSISSIQE